MDESETFENTFLYSSDLYSERKLNRKDEKENPKIEF